MSIEPISGQVPWTGNPAQVVWGLQHYFQNQMDKQLCQYLPSSIALFADREISADNINQFIDEMVEQLSNEIEKRNKRVKKFVDLGLLTTEEIDSFLLEHTDSQPWALYYGIEGGLGSENVGYKYWREPRGVIPCSTMPNHGVAWWHDNEEFKVWLTTARKIDSEWDWDSDIGHESAHAAFAPVPLFIQTADLTSTLLHVESLKHKREIKPGHLARMIYAYSEMAVITVRGEPRSTHTGTPVVRHEELFALLKLSHELMPDIGFDRALTVYEGTTGWIDVVNSTEIFEIAAPMIRVIPRFKDWLKSFSPPSFVEFKDMTEYQEIAV